jgi:hypothetical protein
MRNLWQKLMRWLKLDLITIPHYTYAEMDSWENEARENTKPLSGVKVVSADKLENKQFRARFR